MRKTTLVPRACWNPSIERTVSAILPILKLVVAAAAIIAAVELEAAPVLGPNGHYYDVVAHAGITWKDASAAATGASYLGLPGHLVTITSAAEQAFIAPLIAAKFGSSFGSEAWAGGFQNPSTQTNPKAGWTWVNGEGSFPGTNSITPYANWEASSPDDHDGPASEQYLGINLWGPLIGWNDEGNTTYIKGYVIEYEGNPALAQINLDFNSGAVPPGYKLTGTASTAATGGLNGSGMVKLTTALTGQAGALTVNDFSGGAAISGFIAEFDLRLGGGSTPPADGLSFNFTPPVSAPTAGSLEEGVGTGLSVCFDVYDNGGGEAPAIDIKYKGQLVATKKIALSSLETGASFAHVQIYLSSDAMINVLYKGSLVHSNVAVKAFTPVAGGQFVLAARTGVYTENVWIDNLQISAIPTATTPYPPAITSQPVSATVTEGEEATFSVSATGTSPLKYQWRFNSVPLPSQTNSLFTITNVTLANAGTYDVVVSNLFRIETSIPATLTVNARLPATNSLPFMPPGLVAWWRAENNTADSAGTNPGVFVNGARYAPGISGQAFSFTNAALNYVKVPYSRAFDINAHGTISFWHRLSRSQPQYPALITRGDNADANNNFEVYIVALSPDTATYKFSLGNGSGTSSISDVAALLDDRWHHIAFTWDGLRMIVYIDGALEHSASQTITPATIGTPSLLLGAATPGDQRGSPNGFLDEVALFDRALDPSEVQSLFASAADVPGNAIQTNLLKNGSFENPILPDGSGFTNKLDGWNWGDKYLGTRVTPTGGVIFHRPRSIFGNPQDERAQDADQYIYLNLGGVNEGIYQDFTISKQGRYMLTWYDNNMFQNGQAAYTVLILAAPVANVVDTAARFDGTAAPGNIWQNHQLTATLAVGAYTLQLLPKAHIGAVLFPFLDNFSLTALKDPPTITSFSPTSGPSSGGTTVAISGAGFTRDSMVTFGTNLAASLIFVSEASLLAVTPPGLPGRVEITVANPNGGKASFSNGFTLLEPEPPSITKIIPAIASSSGGTLLTILGTGFESNSIVTIAGKALPLASTTSTNIAVISPPLGSGTYDVTVSYSTGASAVLPYGFTAYDNLDLEPRTVSTIRLIAISSTHTTQSTSFDWTSSLKQPLHWNRLTNVIRAVSGELVDLDQTGVGQRFYRAASGDSVSASLVSRLSFPGRIGSTYRLEFKTATTSAAAWTFLQNVTVQAQDFSYIDTSLGSGQRVYRVTLVPSPKKYVGRVVLVGRSPIPADVFATLGAEQRANLQGLGIIVNDAQKTIEFPPRPVPGYWVSIGGQKVMCDSEGLFAVNDFQGIPKGRVLAERSQSENKAEAEFDTSILVEEGLNPKEILVPFLLDPSYMDGLPLLQPLRAEAVVDPICGAADDSHACCRDYDGYLYQVAPPASKPTGLKKLPYYLGSTCFRLVNSGLCAREMNSHCQPILGDGIHVIWRDVCDQLATPGISCWAENHKFRNCQNIDGSFTFDADKSTVLCGQDVRLRIFNNTAANETVINSTHGDLTGDRLFGLFGDYTLQHYSDLDQRHFNESYVIFHAPNFAQMPAGVSRLHVGFHVEANGKRLAKWVDVVTVDHLSVSPPQTSLSPGAKIVLTPTAYDDQGNDLRLSPTFFQWKSSDANIATVDAVGTILGLKAGKAMVTVTETQSGKAFTVSVEVLGVDHLQIIPQNPALAKGNSIQLQVVAYDHNGNTIPVNGLKFYWTTGNASVADVNKDTGLVTGKGEGTAQILVTELTSSKTASVSVTVTGDLPAIYSGTFAGNSDGGGFAVLIRPNRTAVVVGYNAVADEGVFSDGFIVASDGTVNFQTVEGGHVTGKFDAISVSGVFADSEGNTGTFAGGKKPSTGIQQAAAGYYAGTFDGVVTGAARAIIAADGSVFFFTSVPGGESGGFGTLNAANQLAGRTVEGVNIAGSLNPTTLTASGSYSLSFQGTALTGTFIMRRQ